jgi:fumarate hydratase class II
MSPTDARRELWGGETRKAIDNFPVSGEPIPAPVARWLGRIKAAAARVNAELGLLDEEKAERIAAAGDRIAAGELDNQFPIDVFQTGSGTSSNMNANEVIASPRARTCTKRRRNMGQCRTTCSRPPCIWLRIGELVDDRCALDLLADSLAAKVEFDDVIKPAARTGWTPFPSRRPGVRRLRGPGARGRARQSTLARLGQVPLGGTAIGTGLNHHQVRGPRRRIGSPTGQARHHPPADPFRVAGGARPRRGLRRAEGGRRLADEDRERPLSPAPARAPASQRSSCPSSEGLVDHARQSIQ